MLDRKGPLLTGMYNVQYMHLVFAAYDVLDVILLLSILLYVHVLL